MLIWHHLGHSLRRTSATIFANTGATIEALKRHTGHRSTTVCESYIDESIAHKKRTSNDIISSLNCTSTSSNAVGSSSSMHYAKISSLDCASTSSTDKRATPANNVSCASTSSTDERSTTPKNEIDSLDETGGSEAFDVEPRSQINASQYSNQTFMAEMEKKFAFYKCERLTINFQPNFDKEKK